jgi:hypothetical protein
MPLEILGIPPVSISTIYFFVRLRRLTFLPIAVFLVVRLVFLILLTPFFSELWLLPPLA